MVYKLFQIIVFIIYPLN